MPAPLKAKALARARAEGYRSGLEVRACKELDARGIAYAYEPFRIPYAVPSRPAHYTPDFVLVGNGIVVETKGRWVAEDRKKAKLIREQYPDLDFRLVFSNPNARISKTSQTSYGMVATKLGIPFARERIPEEWLHEPPNEASLAIIKGFSA